jgi:LmbE family N-acetylglucosaminyl deacetylase/glycosyltransferase involved in cell wall biosynthesis
MNENELIPYEAADIAADRVLVVSAHPDDEVFGAGGLIARLAAAGSAVRVLVLSGGEAQERRAEGSADPAIRRAEAREAGRELGVTDYEFFDFPDRGLADFRSPIAARVGAEIRSFRPEIVLAPSPSEIHPDHRAAAEAVFEAVSAIRPEDTAFEAYQRLRIVYFEVTQPILPNALVPLGTFGEAKRRAAAKFPSQAAVRDYAGAVEGLNAFRALTLGDAGPAEAFRVVTWRDAVTRSLEEIRREIGPGAVAGGPGTPADVGVVVRTRNRPALLAEALESLAAQRRPPRRVVVVNDGGTPVGDVLGRFQDRLAIELVEHSSRRGRARAANDGAARVAEALVAFLDDDDLLAADHFAKLLEAREAGPEPIVYSDAATVLLERDGSSWREKHRELQYSNDFDPDLLLWANYIPLHTVLFDAGLFRKAGGFDPELDYSEDWDLLIRLSAEAPFRHVRAVTCEYRVFEGEEGHEAAGSDAFRRAREQILRKHRERRTDEAMLRVLDRLGRRQFDLARRHYVLAGELEFHRRSHERAVRELAEVGRSAREESSRREMEVATLRRRLEELEAELAGSRARADARGEEAEALRRLVQAMEGTKAWKLHRLAEILRGRG